MTPDERERRGNPAWFATRFALTGLVIGSVLGLGGAALVSASGIGGVDLPPIAAPTTPEPTKAAKPKPAPKPKSPEEAPKPSIEASSTQVSPGERFFLTGEFPDSDAGQTLQVEVRDVGEDQDWDDFPIQTKTRDGGEFKAELYTSRTGGREFRIKNVVTGLSTPTVEVEIG
ncbi:hypothetical protein GEV29_15510 [Aeromicrobium sp. SMF47]|uniref:Uncharacterized protein n=1 Tax=Aeromicrobium yanjiei TaxID=2662028 RepID=A0A5Q2MEB9_9ACTN|nr:MULTISPECIES: hypothetical protein [Aeromicrobium]MRJ77948.1 hypothetical protein [Aeromicrobium yanjiei]MRK02308.1 hypothetical protein [Aeromicrobium sp. S22]QGG40968.1 hypothetical protein GEV26_06120 [Aeromicrobium yanjiei]